MYRVYELIDPRTGGVFYVGRDKSGKRPDQHVAETRRWLRGRGTYGNNTHKLRVIAQILAAGLRPRRHVPIETPDFHFACEAERFLIANYGAVLTNKAPGGEGGRERGFSVSEVTRQKIRAKLAGRKLPPEQAEKMKGRAPWNKGGTHSQETRAKLRASHLGQRHTEETIRKRSESLRRTFSLPEHKQRLKGRKPWNKGVSLSLEARRRISEVQRGRTASRETRQRMSDAHASRWASMTAEKREAIRQKLCSAWVRRRGVING